MSDPVPCLWMRGGTSKGGYFLAADLPADPAARDALLLRVMGSPDPRQIDGMGGADPLTSKVAVVRRSDRPGIDVDYLFLQVFVDQAIMARLPLSAGWCQRTQASRRLRSSWKIPVRWPWRRCRHPAAA